MEKTTKLTKNSRRKRRRKSKEKKHAHNEMAAKWKYVCQRRLRHMKCEPDTVRRNARDSIIYITSKSLNKSRIENIRELRESTQMCLSEKKEKEVAARYGQEKEVNLILSADDVSNRNKWLNECYFAFSVNIHKQFVNE